MGRNRKALCWIFAATIVVTACARDNAKYQHPVPPLDAGTRAELGPVAIEVASPPRTASAPGVPVVPEVTAGKAFGAAALASLPVLALPAGCLGEPFCTVGMAAIAVSTYVVMVPVLAITALASAPPDKEKVGAATETINRVLQTTEWDAILRREVETAMRVGGKTLADAATSPRLKLTLEGPWMVTDRFIAVPTLTIHGELARDGACLIDRRWRWNGKSDDFVDFGGNDGARYRSAMQDGIKVLSQAIVADLFFATQPRKTAYLSESAFKSGSAPRLAAVPMLYEDRIASWYKTDADAEKEPRCGGLGG